MGRKLFAGWLAGCAVIWVADRSVAQEVIAACFTAAAVFFALKYIESTQPKDQTNDQ